MFNKKKKPIDVSFNANDCKRINKLIEQEGGQAQIVPNNHILCSQCKAIIKKDYKFCPICGTKNKSDLEKLYDHEAKRGLYPLILEIKNSKFDQEVITNQYYDPIGIPGVKVNVTVNSTLYQKEDVLREIKHIFKAIINAYS